MTYRRAGRAGLALGGVVGVFAGCQDTFELSIDNRCAGVVEVAVETLPPSRIPDDFEPDFDRSDPVLTTRIGMVSTRTTEVTVWVRADEDATPITFSVALDDVDPGRDEDDDVTIPIEGDHCPA